jgi:hypothetical protein
MIIHTRGLGALVTRQTPFGPVTFDDGIYQEGGARYDGVNLVREPVVVNASEPQLYVVPEWARGVDFSRVGDLADYTLNTSYAASALGTREQFDTRVQQMRDSLQAGDWSSVLRAAGAIDVAMGGAARSVYEEMVGMGRDVVFTAQDQGDEAAIMRIEGQRTLAQQPINISKSAAISLLAGMKAATPPQQPANHTAAQVPQTAAAAAAPKTVLPAKAEFSFDFSNPVVLGAIAIGAVMLMSSMGKKG